MGDHWNGLLYFTDSLSLLITSGYAFILVVNFLDWKKNRRLDLSDQLISGIASLILVHCVSQVTFRYIILICGSSVITSLLYNLLYISPIFCLLLFSTWLALHYCLKIVTIHRSLYTSIQRLFPTMFPWILLLSVLVSLLISAPAAYNMSRKYLNSTGDSFQLQSYSPLRSYPSLQLYFAFSFMFILIFLVLVLVSITSLYRHVHRLQRNAATFRDETARAHVSAVKALVCLLVFDVICFALLILSTVIRHDHRWRHSIFLLFSVWHVTGLPMLIRVSSKLQKTLFRCVTGHE